MSTKKLAICMAVLLLIPVLATAQEARNGTAAASYLLVPQGARYLSGGGATAIADGIEAVIWNPAGLVRTEKPINAMFSRRSYIADININFLGAGINFGEFGSLAMTMRSLEIGEIGVTTVFDPDGEYSGVYEPTIFVVGGTYSKLLTDRTSVGVTMNYISESFTSVSATALSFDVGIQYSSFLDVQNLNIGVVMKNFGTPMRYGGSGLWRQAQAVGTDRIVTWYKVEAASFDLPSVIDIGTSYRLNLGESNSIDVGITFENNHSAQDEYRLMAAYHVGDVVSLRASYLSSESEGDLENIFASTAFGGSLNLQALAGLDMSLDYSFISTEYFDNNQVFSLRFSF